MQAEPSQLTPLRKKHRNKLSVDPSLPADGEFRESSFLLECLVRSQLHFAVPLFKKPVYTSTPRTIDRNKQNQDANTPISGKKSNAQTPKSSGTLSNTPKKQTKGRQSKVKPVDSRLEEYCRQFFKELSQNIFDNKFGDETKLGWNNRLTRTAGKAHYSR